MRPSLAAVAFALVASAACKRDGVVPARDGVDPVEQPDASAPAPTTPTAATPTAAFAYYVLTLSWSPSFCASPAGTRSPGQCAAGRRYAFVVHGLWPQNATGWPESCATADHPSRDLVTRMLDLMPSEKLIAHEWEKHGTCSGLSADAYFARVRDAYGAIHIPPAFVAPQQAFTTDLDGIERAFIGANPGLTADRIAVLCKGELDEVRICLDTDLKPRDCGRDVRDACKGTVTVPPMR